MKTVVTLLTIFACVLVASCVAVTSEKPTANGAVAGIPYYLPQTLLDVTFQNDGATNTLGVTATDIPNGAQKYGVNYNASVFADDKFCVARTSTGLLSKLYFSADDKLDDFLLNVAELFATVAGDSRFISGSNRMFGDPKTPIRMSIDPYDDEQLAALNAMFQQAYPNTKFKVKIPGLPRKDKAFSCPNDKVCFATKLKVPVQLYADGELVAQQYVDVVDQSGFGALDVSRAFMVAKFTKLDFDSGVLKAVRIRKDSEAVGVSEFPLNVIERVASVPANAISRAFGTSAEKKALKEERTGLGNGGTPTTTPDATDLKILDGCVKDTPL